MLDIQKNGKNPAARKPMMKSPIVPDTAPSRFISKSLVLRFEDADCPKMNRLLFVAHGNAISVPHRLFECRGC
jgi:hypothetical protein